MLATTNTATRGCAMSAVQKVPVHAWIVPGQLAIAERKCWLQSRYSGVLRWRVRLRGLGPRQQFHLPLQNVLGLAL